MIISFINTKGGVGKTTLCVNVAGEIARTKGKPVLIVYLDPQKSSGNWAERRRRPNSAPRFPLVVKIWDVTERWPSQEELKRRTAGFDDVLLDGAAGETHISSAALNMSDFVVVPCMPDENSYTGTMSAISRIIKPSLRVKRVVPWNIAVNSFDKRTNEAHEYDQRIRNTWPDRVYAPVVRRLVAFQLAMSSGRTVTELDPDSEATGDIRRITFAILATAVPRIAEEPTPYEHEG